MHIAWISMKITVSELKQVWSVLLQSKNSEIFRAGTAIIRTENFWSLLKTTEHCLALMKISEHFWKCLRTALNVHENLWSSLKRPKHSWTTYKFSARLWKCLKITENYYIWNLKRSENLCWRSSFPNGLRTMFCRLFMYYT